MVPTLVAQSQAVIRSAPWPPMSTTSSPGCDAVVVAAVDHDLVHGDAAGERAAAAADQHLAAGDAEPPGHAVGVADRHGGHRGRLRQRPAQPVGHAVARRHPAHVGDPRPQRQRRPEAGDQLVGGQRRARGDAVQRDPAAHHVVAGSRATARAPAELQACTIGGRRPSGAKLGDDSVEPGALLVGEGVRRLVGHGEVGPHAPEDQLGPVGHRLGDRHRLLGRRAHPVHAGVDLDVDGQRRGRRPRRPPWPRPPPRARCRGSGVSDRATTSAMASAGGSESRRTGASIPWRRSTSPSSTRATASHDAPPSARPGRPPPTVAVRRRP